VLVRVPLQIPPTARRLGFVTYLDNHFHFVGFDLDRRVIVPYDSLNGAVPASVVDEVCTFVKQVRSLDGFNVIPAALPKQSNSTDCGALLLRGSRVCEC
jgi:hypothetical protein